MYCFGTVSPTLEINWRPRTGPMVLGVHSLGDTWRMQAATVTSETFECNRWKFDVKTSYSSLGVKTLVVCWHAINLGCKNVGYGFIAFWRLRHGCCMDLATWSRRLDSCLGSQVVACSWSGHFWAMCSTLATHKFEWPWLDTHPLWVGPPPLNEGMWVLHSSFVMFSNFYWLDLH